MPYGPVARVNRRMLMNGSRGEISRSSTALSSGRTPRQPPSKIIWSLLGIGNCIDALSKNGTQRGPYRGSSLAYILEGSLGGSFRTLMVKQ
ncbi:hypothetical protein HPB49_017320 [Dermacentor silvarum]|uniref:Uncharacterized protein n=1 Tax=Dermacentor silvarum TaxID=543639 RepID=A0ACB8E1U9_DERSI|nr:hypothetical protein HPB49_017320 [Dermacentor silvarum]